MSFEDKAEKKKTKSDSSSIISPTTKALVVLNMLKNENVLTEEDVTNLRALPELDLNTIFEKILKTADSLTVYVSVSVCLFLCVCLCCTAVLLLFALLYSVLFFVRLCSYVVLLLILLSSHSLSLSFVFTGKLNKRTK
jgi:hypothetical protein